MVVLEGRRARFFWACLVIYLSKHAFLMALALYNHDLSLAAC